MNRKRLCFFLMTAAAGLFAGVNLRVNTGVVVRTTGDVLVKIDGDITEDGPFVGRLGSGNRTGVTEFAGLTLGSGLEGSVMRITGSAYTEGNGEGTNVKRYYQVDNSGSQMSTDLSAVFRTAGTWDEQNGLSGPYYLYRFASSAWAVYGSGTSGSPVTVTDAVIPAGASDWVISVPCRVAAKLFLEGPYDTGTHLMTTTLGPGGTAVIPLTAPYAEDSRTCAAVTSGVTDWVLVQLRSTASGTESASRSCFLRADGMLTEADGTTTQIPVPAAPGDYYLVLRHRNHLSVMSASAVTGLTWGGTASMIDFTAGTGQYYGSDAVLLETGVYGLYAGDCNQDGGVTVTDNNMIMSNRNDEGYEDSDLNMDGNVTISDNNLSMNNRNISSQVP
ncbi:hypothetical protein JW948_11145 [bacterium]|nr:hypothetical protein [bacterium]